MWRGISVGLFVGWSFLLYVRQGLGRVFLL